MAQEPRSTPPRQTGAFSILQRIDHGIGRLEALILSWGILIMAINTIANVLGRYVFSQSIYFSEELNEFLMVIVTFMGLSYATRKGIHIRMSALYDALPDKARKIMMILIAITTAVMMAVLTWYAFEYVQKVAMRGRVTPALQFPLYLTYIWVIIGFAVTTVQYVLTALRNLDLSDDTVYVSFNEIDSYDDPETEAALRHHEAETDSDESDSSQGGRS
jgi:TRAP-type C4-dicarboxylate transport system permease small subunit